MEDGTFMGDTLPNFSDLFIGYEARIQTIFDRIVAASSVNPPPKLEFTEEHSSMLFKCKPSEASVTADWHGIASLWAMSQGVGRLCAAMFNARRSGQARLDFVEGSEAELGYHFIHEARALVKPRGHRWNTYFPKPDLGSDRLIAGDIFFFRAIEWILAHEVGHIVSGHDDRAWTAQQSRDEEREADRFATCYVMGELAADPGRQPVKGPRKTRSSSSVGRLPRDWAWSGWQFTRTREPKILICIPQWPRE
ncbi:phage exclusion protein Lit family protein [Rhizobium sp. BR 317]|uniref:phage exclusion protein Lit family protein n=1 Tax=Rhizobium sp. BR 317 TaxID=3040015 RepID=UPI0039BF8E69